MDIAKNRVLSELTDLPDPITTSQLAEKLNLSRSVVSHYLNELLLEKKVVKQDGRPVLWSVQAAASKKASARLTDFVGVHGSLKKTIEQVKAAVVYPPNGLNILITGHSGVGKSYLASKIGECAKKEGIIAKDAPYIVLNCADYANNPELVSSMLFGYVKGAYTGADEEKDGLLQQADHGYLFLDEVHRLSSENQEKLFSFIDSGQFFKMGDNSTPHKAQVRLIMATTEDPEKVLLTTFLRRIPIRIKLPDYAKRPLDERLDILHLLFYREAKTMQRKLEIEPNLLAALLQVDNPGNIGYLKNAIRVACASAYREQVEQETIVLKLGHLPIPLRTNTENYGSLMIDYQVLPKLKATSQLDSKFDQIKADLQALTEDFSSSSMKQVKLDLLSLDQQEAKQELNDNLHSLHQKLYQKIIEEKFGLSQAHYLEEVLYLFYASNFAIADDQLEQLQPLVSRKLPRTYHVASTFYQELVKKDQRDYRILMLVLTLLLSDHVDENIKLRALMVAHGKGSATSIQSVVNTLCGNYIFDAIDMPIDAGVDKIIAEANKLIDSFNTTNGFVLMVDMGSLSQLYSTIKDHLDGDLLVVNNITTLTALDIALKMQANTDFKNIAEKADNYRINVQYYEGFSQSPNILVSCISGIGISEKVKEIIQPILPNKIKVIPLDYATLKEKIRSQEWNYFSNTLFVLTTMDISDEVSFRHLNLYDLLDASGEKQLRKWLGVYLSEDQINYFFQKLLQFFSKEGISERLAFLNPDVILNEVEAINSKYENFYHLKLDGKVKLNLYMHIALMIERLMLQRTADIKVEVSGKQEEQFFMITHSIFQPIEMKYNIKLSDYEISLLYELFKQFID